MKMTCVRRFPLVPAVLIFLLAAFAAVPASAAHLSFNWAFVKRAADGSPAAIDFRERVAITPGDLFKIHVQPIQNAYVYLVLQDAQGDIQLLFPSRFDVFSGPGYMGSRNFVPEGDEWFTPDATSGTERFHLLASTQRLGQLETLLAAFSRATGGARGPAGQAVLDEIARLRKEHSQLTMAAEKPVTIAGGTRGLQTSIQKIATRIDAEEFYYKLFRLEH